jgi:hypothetical protein
MKLLAWAMSAGLVAGSVLLSGFLATAANAQGSAPNGADQGRLSRASDVDNPYAGAPPPPPPMPPRPYGYGPDYGYAPPPPPAYGYGGYGPQPLPLPEIYAVLRENGFSPLGAPYQRGMTYVIAAMDRGGEDGRLVIDARNGRIIRFVPASRWGEAYDRMGYGMDAPYPPAGPMPPPIVIRSAPRPPGSIPRVASRTVPMPSPKPTAAGKPLLPTQQSAATETKPAAPPPPQVPNATVGEVKPVPQIQPTQKMPVAQGLD